MYTEYVCTLIYGTYIHKLVSCCCCIGTIQSSVFLGSVKDFHQTTAEKFTPIECEGGMGMDGERGR